MGKLPAGASNEASVSSVEPEEFVLDVRFDAPPGVTILFGASGAGKSVTLKSIAGLVRPDAGRIAVNDCVLFDSESSVNLPIRERGAGYVFQNLALFPHLSALGNVEFALSGLPRREGRGRALELLEQFGIRHAAMRRPREISGGEAQRVALARALASNPRFLLLDEPLSALDEATKFGIISDLKNINRRFQLPVIYVTHSREEAVMLGERAILYERGRVVAVGEPLKVFATPLNKSVARLSGVENVFRCRVVGNDETAGTLTLEIDEDGAAGACRIDAPFGNYAAGERVTLAVRSGDILLATEEPRSTSARNILRGRITAMEERSGHIRVHVTSGANWIVSVTRQAAAELQLSNEMEIWLAFKTFSCHLLDG
ncbi:MAG TPA: ATP-binding cassette domain-containing protein [Pyrinomonadaceae bacterium]